MRRTLTTISVDLTAPHQLRGAIGRAVRPALTLLMVVAFGWTLASALEQDDSTRGDADPHVNRFLERTDAPLVNYRAVRRLEASARKGQMRASMTAMTSFDKDAGLQFQILEESGSGLIRTKVLRAALEAEQRALRTGDAARSAISKVNYDFGSASVAEPGLVRVDIRPRRQAAMLIDGSIVMTEGDADLVSVEGRLVKRPSFWTRRVEVVRRYARLAGVRVPVSMESTADVLIGGRSTFSMQYEYETINSVRLSTGGH